MHRCHRLISRYMEEDEDAEATTAVELSGNFPVEISGTTGFHISARLDRIIVRPSSPEVLIVRDYKVASSLRPLDPIQIYLNLCVAKLAHKGAFKRYVLELVNLTDDCVETTEYHSANLKGVHKHVVSLVHRYESATEHPATRSETLPVLPLAGENAKQTAQRFPTTDIAFDDYKEGAQAHVEMSCPFSLFPTSRVKRTGDDVENSGRRSAHIACS